MNIKINDVCKSFKDNIIINNATMEFKEGIIYGLIGENGSGKSVLLKLLCGFYKPDSGKILINETEISKNNTHTFDIRALIEKPSFFPNLTGYENLELLAKICNKISKNDILNTLSLVNLTNEKDKKYSSYSLGMKQKLGIAQVLMENPKIIILDEPFNGIDSESVKKIKEFLLSIKKEKIIVISSHLNEDINNFIDIVYMFNNGNITKGKMK